MARAAKKAKTPALAGGAALAGLAGGLALASRGRGRRVLGVKIPGARPARGKDLLKVAGEIGSTGLKLGELASEVRLAREQLETKQRRSPIEVVLDGLTARRKSDAL